MAFADVKKKFLHDLPGVTANGADGIVFFTNQALSPGERDTLQELANDEKCRSLIYHVERLRALLDSPIGYGVRLEFLHIAMTPEEQLSFVSTRDSALSEALQRHTSTILAEMARRFDRLDGQNDSLAAGVRFPGGFAVQTFAASLESPPPSDKRVVESTSVVTGELSVGTLCMLHQALLLDSPDADEVGQLRSSNIWLGSPSATPDRATYVPPDAEEVPALVAALVADWNGVRGALASKTKPEVLNEITRFHHRFLKIHPFRDGNGRVARFLLAQQVRALLGQRRSIVIEDSAAYAAALAKADKGDFGALEALITQAVYGQETISGG